MNVSLKYPDLNYTMSKFYKNKDFNSLVKGKNKLAITRATTNLALTYQNYDMNFYLGG